MRPPAAAAQARAPQGDAGGWTSFDSLRYPRSGFLIAQAPIVQGGFSSAATAEAGTPAAASRRKQQHQPLFKIVGVPSRARDRSVSSGTGGRIETDPGTPPPRAAAAGRSPPGGAGRAGRERGTISAVREQRPRVRWNGRSGAENVFTVPKAKTSGKAWRSLGSPTPDTAAWGHSPDVPVWRDVTDPTGEVARRRPAPPPDGDRERRRRRRMGAYALIVTA